MNQNIHLGTELFVQKYTQLPGVLYEVWRKVEQHGNHETETAFSTQTESH